MPKPRFYSFSRWCVQTYDILQKILVYGDKSSTRKKDSCKESKELALSVWVDGVCKLMILHKK